MSNEVVTGVKTLIARRCPLDFLSINWFGGEPLLATKTIMNISEFIQELLLSSQVNRYYASITTNGFILNEDKLKKMYSCGLRKIQVTLKSVLIKMRDNREAKIDAL